MKYMALVLLLFLSCQSNLADDNKLFKSNYELLSDLYDHGKQEECILKAEEIFTLFEKKQHQYIKSDSICKIVYDSYLTYCLNINKSLSDTEKIIYFSKSLYIVEKNKSCIRLIKNRQQIINNYIILIGLLIDQNRKDEAMKYNIQMVEFAEEYFKMDLSSVLLSSSFMNSRMGEFKRNYNIFQRMYEMFNELDRLEKEKVIAGLIHIEFLDANYKEVIRLVCNHSDIINSPNAFKSIKQPLANIISASYERYAFEVEDSSTKGIFSENVNRAYYHTIHWNKNHNPSFYPRSLIYAAYYCHKFEDHQKDAINLYYSYLNELLLYKPGEIFHEDFRNEGDALNAIVSIIVAAVNYPTYSFVMKNFYKRYESIIIELKKYSTKEQYNDLMHALEIGTKYLRKETPNENNN